MCGPLFLTLAGIGLLSVGTCLGFLTAALFATGGEPVQLANPNMAVSIPEEIELIRQAAESLYTLASCMREGKDPFGQPMADASRALHRVADRLPALLREVG
jgi:hypothetical protein